MESVIMGSQKIKTTMNIESNLLMEVKEMANAKKITQTEIVNKLLKKGLLLEKQAEKQKATKGNNFLKLAGIVTAEKPFNATEEVKKLRNGEL